MLEKIQLYSNTTVYNGIDYVNNKMDKAENQTTNNETSLYSHLNYPIISNNYKNFINIKNKRNFQNHIKLNDTDSIFGKKQMIDSSIDKFHRFNLFSNDLKKNTDPPITPFHANPNGPVRKDNDDDKGNYYSHNNNNFTNYNELEKEKQVIEQTPSKTKVN